jgi:hypothetical protein
MNKKSPYIFLLSAILIQLLQWIAIYLLMKFAFCSDSILSEEIATVLTACFMAIGGLSGIFFSSLGIYYIILNNKPTIILPVIIFLFLPILVISTINFYAFLILSAIL